MRGHCLVMLTLLVLLAGVAASQSSHYNHPVYLWGGWYTSPTTANGHGVNLLDVTGPSPQITHLMRLGHYAGGFCMDVDNRHVLVAVRGSTNFTTFGQPQRGFYRLDPVTGAYTTIVAGPVSSLHYMAFHDVVVDQDGDYIVAYQRFRNSPYTDDYYLYKFDQTGAITTVLTTGQIGGAWAHRFSSKMTWNMANGKLLVPTTSAVLDVDTVRNTTTFWTSLTLNGWNAKNHTPFNYLRNAIEGPINQEIYRYSPGGGRVKLATLSNLPCTPYGTAMFDLQTAASRRMVYVSYGHTPPETWLLYLDAKNWSFTSTRCSTLMRGLTTDLEHYRGRHIQTALANPKLLSKWTILLSCPQYAGKSYLLAAGLSGVFPGLPLRDGRSVNLNVDPLFFATLQNQLPGIWNPGPGVLDVKGEARGELNLVPVRRPSSGWGVPFWIAMIVLDPKAPTGVAYVPDTYVMRL